MSEMSPRKGSAVWAMLLTVIAAWAACGVYRWRVPPLVEARAVVQVPAATDLESMCEQPDLREAAERKLNEDDTGVSLTGQTDNAEVSGKLSARKIQHAHQLDSPHAATTAGTSETWELIYRTGQSDRALDDLSAFVAVVEDRVASVTETGLDGDRHEDSSVRIQELEDECLEAELELEALADGQAPSQEGGEFSSPRQMTLSTQSLAELRSERQQMEAEWNLVQQEFLADPDLEIVATKLTPGLLREAILELDRQQKLSLELTGLNDTEQRLSRIYGDRHPKLIEVRKKFDHVLAELGGWDAVVDEQHFAERLQAVGQDLIALKQQQEDDLQLQAELEREQSGTTDEVARQRSLLTRHLAKLKQELAAAQATEADSPAQTSTEALYATVQSPQMVSTPWYFNLGALFGLTTICGLIAGLFIHWSWPASEGVDDSDLDLPPIPSFVPVPQTQLDLAQRRAIRQARLQQAYAG